MLDLNVFGRLLSVSSTTIAAAAAAAETSIAPAFPIQGDEVANQVDRFF